MSAKKNVSAIRTLIERCSTTWDGIGLVSRYLRGSHDGISVACANYKPGLGFKPLYQDRYNDLYAANQFHIEFNDKGFVQFYFAFDSASGGLVAAKMAYFPPPIKAASEIRFDADSKNF